MLRLASIYLASGVLFALLIALGRHLPGDCWASALFLAVALALSGPGLFVVGCWGCISEQASGAAEPRG